MQTRHAGFQQFPALFDREVNSDLIGFLSVVLVRLQFLNQFFRYYRAAHIGKLFDLLVIHNRDNSWNDGFIDARSTGFLYEIVIVVIIKKHLSNNEMSASVYLVFQIFYVVVNIYRFRVLFRIACCTYTK
jgi:hypothetical protein